MPPPVEHDDVTATVILEAVPKVLLRALEGEMQRALVADLAGTTAGRDVSLLVPLEPLGRCRATLDGGSVSPKV